MKKLVAVMTCHANVARANAQRRTWVPFIREHADVQFFLGAPPKTLDGSPEPDETWFPDVVDDYRGIPLKVQRICQWAVERGYDYVMKADDDVYIAPKRFPALPLTGDYVGRFRSPAGRYPAHFASGFAYWLSQKAAAIVAGTHWNKDWMDERFVANALAHFNVFGYTDPVNYLVTGPHLEGAEVINRAILHAGTVFCEYKNPKAMMSMHAALCNMPPVPNHPGLRAAPAVYCSEELLYAPPCDQIPVQKRTWE